MAVFCLRVSFQILFDQSYCQKNNPASRAVKWGRLSVYFIGSGLIGAASEIPLAQKGREPANCQRISRRDCLEAGARVFAEPRKPALMWNLRISASDRPVP